MTLFCGVLEPSSGALSFVCAGHPFPLLRAMDGDVRELGLGSLPLGIRHDLALVAMQAEVGEGDTLLLYTDGAFEAIDENDQEMGERKLLDGLVELHGLPPDESLAEAIRRGQEGFEFFGYALNALVAHDQVPGRTDLWGEFQARRSADSVERRIAAADAQGDVRGR